MENLLEVQHLKKIYKGFTLQDVSFSLPKGMIMGFIGENGAGKTTTIKMILDLIRRDGGSVRLFGKDDQADLQKAKDQIGVVFDEGFFYEGLNPKDIGRIMKRLTKQWDDGLYKRYLKEWELPQNKTVKEFSKGMRMKLSMATALSHHPKLLILDEATSGLDPVARNEMLDIFLDFIQDEEHSILFSTHITGDIERIADYVTLIHKGMIVFSQQKDELIESYGILKCAKDDFSKIAPHYVTAYRENAFGVEALIKDRQEFRYKYRNFTIDPPTIEEIMLFYIRGEKK